MLSDYIKSFFIYHIKTIPVVFPKQTLSKAINTYFHGTQKRYFAECARLFINTVIFLNATGKKRQEIIQVSSNMKVMVHENREL